MSTKLDNVNSLFLNESVSHLQMYGRLKYLKFLFFLLVQLVEEILVFFLFSLIHFYYFTFVTEAEFMCVDILTSIFLF